MDKRAAVETVEFGVFVRSEEQLARAEGAVKAAGMHFKVLDEHVEGWCRFFLEAVRTQAEDNLAKARAILGLYEEMKRRVPEMTRSQYAIHALEWIFERPIFKSSDFATSAGIPEPTARRFLGVLRDGGVLKAMAPGRGRRAAVLACPALLNIAEGREVV